MSAESTPPNVMLPTDGRSSRPNGGSDASGKPTDGQGHQLKQPQPVRGPTNAFAGDSFGPAVNPPRTRSTPPTNSTFVQPRQFVPHKSNGPPMPVHFPPAGGAPDKQAPANQYQHASMYPFYYAPPQTMFMYGVPHGRGIAPGPFPYGAPPHLPLQQPPAPQVPPPRRVRKALAIVDPATGKEIDLESDGPAVTAAEAKAPSKVPDHVPEGNHESPNIAVKPTNRPPTTRVAGVSDPARSHVSAEPTDVASPATRPRSADPSQTSSCRSPSTGKTVTISNAPAAVIPAKEQAGHLSSRLAPSSPERQRSASPAPSAPRSPSRSPAPSASSTADRARSISPVSVRNSNTDGERSRSPSKSPVSAASSQRTALTVNTQLSAAPTSPRRYSVKEMLSLQPTSDVKLPEGLSLSSPCLKSNPITPMSGPSSSRHAQSSRFESRRSSRHSSTGSGAFRPVDAGRRSTSERFDDRRYSNGSNRSGRRGSHRSASQRFEIARDEPHVEPLARTENRWNPKQKPSDEFEAVKRQLKSMLNKLTLDKFDTLSTKIIDLVKDKVSSADQLRDVVELIFDKALSESTFVKMYSSLCVAISNAIPTFNDDQQQDQSFKRILLNQCQREFERGTSLKTVEADECDPALLAQAAIRRKQRFLGNVRFIGELFKDSMLAERIMHTCITHFLQEVVEPLEEDIEALCKLLSTIGTKIDHAAAKRHMDVYFNRMLSMTRNPALSPRARFMILDVVDMRRNRWKPRRQQMEAKPLDEFREEMEKEAAEKERSSRMARSSSSRFDGFANRGVSPRVKLNRQATSGPERSSHSRGGSESFDMRRTNSFSDRKAVTPAVAKQSPAAEGSQQHHPKPVVNARTVTAPVSSAPQPKKTPSQKDKLKSFLDEVDSLIRDFLKNPGGYDDIQSALASMSDWDTALRNKHLASKTVGISIEQGETERTNASSLLAFLHESRVLHQQDIVSAFRENVEFLTDIICDVPFAAEYFGTMYGDLIAKEVVPLESVFELVFSDQVQAGSFGEFVKHILYQLAEVKGHESCLEMLRGSQFDLHVFARHPFGPDMGRYIDDNSLNEMFPELSLRDDLLGLLSSGASPSKLSFWISNNVERNAHRSASVAVRAVLEHIVGASTYPDLRVNTKAHSRPSATQLAAEAQLLQQLSPALGQLAASLWHPDCLLTEVHKLCYSLGFPDGLALRLFRSLSDTVPPSAFQSWRKQAPAYLQKAKTLESVGPWIEQMSGDQHGS
ncbi:MI domain-containing protein [Plasmodiophora brassicae]|uniref:MI domain-containing protein n=1 Tax=Plasmodiophora brassicae TaxID=37360 RepID=A0A0G4IK00_PLABS|nr:hypothetical protein PBRA_004148 [Plasmodiophora brassicae]